MRTLTISESLIASRAAVLATVDFVPRDASENADALDFCRSFRDGSCFIFGELPSGSGWVKKGLLSVVVRVGLP